MEMSAGNTLVELMEDGYCVVNDRSVKLNHWNGTTFRRFGEPVVNLEHLLRDD
jgi:hypothetical protein